MKVESHLMCGQKIMPTILDVRKRNERLERTGGCVAAWSKQGAELPSMQLLSSLSIFCATREVEK